MARQPISASFVVLSLGIAVASICLTHHLSLEIVNRFEDLNVQGDFQHVVKLKTQTESEYFELVRRWHQGELQGISHVVPVIEGRVSHDGQQIPIVGYDPVAAGVALWSRSTSSSNVSSTFLLKDEVIAGGIDVKIGSSVGGAKVVQRLDSSSPHLVADLPTAQNILNRTGQVDLVWLRQKTTPSKWWDQLIPGLLTASNVTTAEPSLEGYKMIKFDWWNPASSLADAIVFNLAMLSFLTLLVAAFIIIQTLQTSIKSRELQFRLMHTLGVSSLETRVLVLFQCALFGVVGCMVGTFLSIVILAFTTDVTLSVAWQTLDDIGLAKAIALGFLVTVIAGVWIQSKPSTKSVLTRNTALVCAGGVVIWSLFEQSGLLGASLLSVALCVIHIALIAPLLTQWTTQIVNKVPMRSLRLRLILRDSFATSEQIRFAVSALSIAVATSIGIGLMLASFRSEFIDMLEQRLSHDLYLSEAAEVDYEFLDSMETIDKWVAYQRGTGLLNDYPVDITAAHLDEFEAARYGYSNSSHDSIFINELSARRYGLDVGDSVAVQVGVRKTTQLPISHVFKDYGEPDPRIVLPSQFAPTGVLTHDSYSLTTQHPEAVIEKISNTHPNVQIANSHDIRQIALRVFNTSFASAQIMVNIAILVAIFGITSALLGMQARRLRDMQVMTLLGTKRSQLILGVLSHNAIVGITTVLTSIPLGVAIAWNLCYQVNPRAYGWSFDLNWSLMAILIPTALGVLAAILAGLEPLRRVIRQLVNEPLPTT